LEDQQPHEFIVYNGALCTMALAWIAIRWRALTQRRLAVALLVFAGIALWLAFGRYGGLYPLIAHLPEKLNLEAQSRHFRRRAAAEIAALRARPASHAAFTFPALEARLLPSLTPTARLLEEGRGRIAPPLPGPIGEP